MNRDNRIICFTAGMMEDFEVIKTNAPDELIEEQLRINCKKEVDGEVIDEEFDLLEEKGYVVELVGSSDSLDEIPEVDKTFDWYDYYPEERGTNESLEEKIQDAKKVQKDNVAKGSVAQEKQSDRETR